MESATTDLRDILSQFLQEMHDATVVEESENDSIPVAYFTVNKFEVGIFKISVERI